MNYYHITTEENWKKIQDEGLLPNSDGDIFLIDDCSIELVMAIALRQIFIPYGDEVIVLSVDGEVLEDIEQDAVGEFESQHQWIAHKAIEPEHIKYIRSHLFTAEDHKQFEKDRKMRMLNISSEQYDEMEAQREELMKDFNAEKGNQ